MSLLNSTQFNTGPTCAGVGPTDTVQDPYKTAQLAVFVILCVFMVATTLFLLWRRRNRRRLRHRSVVPVVFGSGLGVVYILVRAYYDYVGKEHFNCNFQLWLYYLAIPLTVSVDTVTFVRYVHFISARQGVSGDTLKAVALNKQDRTSVEQLGTANFRTWLTGFTNYELFVVQLFLPCLNLSRLQLKEEAFRSVSKMRLISYEILSVNFLLLPFMIICGIRVRTDPVYSPTSGCTGCGVQLADFLIIFVGFSGYLFPFTNFLWRNREQPDALMFQRDAKITSVFYVTFTLVGGILALVDPGSLMKSQIFDWFTFEMISIFFFHWVRVVLQLWRTARIHKLGEQNITLIEVLSDGKGSLLFEKHLMSELANENLLFWREAIKYKLSYDRHPDFEYTQQMARVLYRTFIGRHAQLPINISDELARSIEQRFKGTVSRAVFDEAIIEVYKLLEGPFRRFIRTQTFKAFATTKADFSMSSMNPNAIVPHSGEEGLGSMPRFNIEDYVHQM